VQAEGKVRTQGLRKLGVERRLAKVGSELNGASHFRHHFHGGNETLVGKLGLLLEQLFVLLVVGGVVSVGQLPRHQILVALVAACPPVPFVRALVHDANDLVHELRHLGLQRLCDFDKTVDAHHQEDRVDSVAWNHYFEAAVAGGHVFADDEGS